MTPPLAALRCIAVGLLAAHCAFARGAERVILIDREEFRLQFARDNVKNGRVDTINIKGGWVGLWVGLSVGACTVSSGGMGG
jgi:threonine dehydrogenase-like Zn-dependent dehydrogenase